MPSAESYAGFVLPGAGYQPQVTVVRAGVLNHQGTIGCAVILNRKAFVAYVIWLNLEVPLGERVKPKTLIRPTVTVPLLQLCSV